MAESIIAIALFFILNASAFAYPEPAEKLLRQDHSKETCYVPDSDRGITIYKNNSDGKMIRVFLKDKDELELWIHERYSDSIFSRPDRIFYKTSSGEWKDKNELGAKDAKQLSQRVKFSISESLLLKKCFEEKLKK